MPGSKNDTAAAVERLVAATNAHDLEAIVNCFGTEYLNETPAHPERGFTGRNQVRRNWEQILGAIGDLEVEILSLAVEGDIVWSEWEHRGTRPDGTPHLMRGVIIFGVANGLLASARFYLEPVDTGGATVDDAVRAQVEGGQP